MEIYYKPSVTKQLNRLPKTGLKKIFSKIELLAADPFFGKVLKGELTGLRSFRTWPYRIIYSIDKPYQKIVIYSIVHRQSAY